MGWGFVRVDLNGEGRSEVFVKIQKYFFLWGGSGRGSGMGSGWM